MAAEYLQVVPQSETDVQPQMPTRRMSGLLSEMLSHMPPILGFGAGPIPVEHPLEPFSQGGINDVDEGNYDQLPLIMRGVSQYSGIHEDPFT